MATLRAQLRAAASAYKPLPDEVAPPSDRTEAKLRLTYRAQLEEVCGLELIHGKQLLQLEDATHLEAAWPVVRDAIAAAYKAGQAKALRGRR